MKQPKTTEEQLMEMGFQERQAARIIRELIQLISQGMDEDSALQLTIFDAEQRISDNAFNNSSILLDSQTIGEDEDGNDTPGALDTATKNCDYGTPNVIDLESTGFTRMIDIKDDAGAFTEMFMLQTGYNQSDVAGIVGVSKQLVQKVVSGERRAPAYFVERLTEHLVSVQG